MFNCEHPIFITLKPLSCRYHHDVQVVVDRVHTRASVKESKGYPPPPEKFWIAAPPPQEGDSLAKYSPPFRKILAKNPKSPPPGLKILENFGKFLKFL